MIELIITSAGKKEIVNARQTGTSAIKLSHIGVGSGKYTATEARTSLQSETTRGLTPLITASFSSIRSTMDPTAIPYLIAI